MNQSRISSRNVALRDFARLAEIDRNALWHPYTQMSEYGKQDPIIIERGEGPYLYDVRRRRFLDAFGSMWCNVWGHNHPEIVKAIQQQASQLCHASLFSVSHFPAVELANKLVETVREDYRFADAPTTLNHVFFSDNGSTAVEVAMKMALQYHNQTGQINRTQFLAFTEGYHGDTFGSMAVSSIEVFRRKFAPSLFSVHSAPYPMQVDPDERPGNWRSIDRQVEATLAGLSDRLAAVVIEPVIQGAAGMRPLCEDFLTRLRKYCNEFGILMIADEVFTGFCRTGPVVASSTELVEPDILCLGKGLTGGELPMGVTMASDKVFAAFSGEWAEMKHFLHGHTFSGNPLCCAAASRNLDLIVEHKLKENVKSRSREFAQQLKAKVATHPRVGAIRQRGLAIGVPIKDAKGNEDRGYAGRADANAVCARALEKSRVIFRPLGNIITIVPPLNLESEHITEIVSALADGLQALQA
ncbi:MAG: adenosylmethionine--8-amino-7-oxononanoate transaminase [Planctomycetes bacterium]|nr:adenosylmethionine--8-amino-7-oxononanoate transaminase [Planctomycetota bacterium]